MKRKLNTIQKRNNLNNIYAVDEKGPGGANHKYVIEYETFDENKEKEIHKLLEIQFQKGPRKSEDSIHGVLPPELLEVVRDVLKGFQSGKYPSEYNAKAIEHIELALMYLNRRVEDRSERNVLGTYNK